jgi:hypothetical protein
VCGSDWRIRPSTGDGEQFRAGEVNDTDHSSTLLRIASVYRPLIPAKPGEPNATYWHLKGRIRSAIWCPVQLDLGRVSEAAPEKAKIDFWVGALTELDRLEFKLSEPTLDVKLMRDGERFRVSLTPKPSLARFRYATTLALTPVRPDGNLLPTVSISIRFDVSPDVTVVPDVVNFGYRLPGETVREVVSVVSISGKALEVVRAEVEGEGLTIHPLPQAEQPSYEVTQTVGERVIKAGAVTITVKDGDGVHVLRVPVAVATPEVGRQK